MSTLGRGRSSPAVPQPANFGALSRTAGREYVFRKLDSSREAVPAGWRRMTLDEAEANLGLIVPKLGADDVCRVIGGRVRGPGLSGGGTDTDLTYQTPLVLIVPDIAQTYAPAPAPSATASAPPSARERSLSGLPSSRAVEPPEPQPRQVPVSVSQAETRVLRPSSPPQLTTPPRIREVSVSRQAPVIRPSVVEVPMLEVREKLAIERQDRVVEVPVDRIIEKEIERVVVRTVQVPVEVVVERIVEVPVERIVERVVERLVTVPREVIVERVVEVIKEVTVEVPVERVVEKIVTVPVEVPVERLVERAVEVPVEVPIQTIVEKPVYVDVKVPVTEVKERVVEVPVERTVEKTVQIPIDRVVEVTVEAPVPRQVQRPVPVERVVEPSVVYEHPPVPAQDPCVVEHGWMGPPARRITLAEQGYVPPSSTCASYGATYSPSLYRQYR